MMKNNIFIRSSRRWMQSLAHDIGWNYIDGINHQMSNLHKKNLKTAILTAIKRSILPPLEWFITYEQLTPIPKGIDLIIEPGSRLIKTKKKYIVYCENGLGIFSYNAKKINAINIALAKRMIKKKNFVGFVFYSEASRKAAYSIFDKKTLENKDLGVIYPYANFKPSSSQTANRFGFCSSLFILKGGRELVDVIHDNSALFRTSGLIFDIVTSLNSLPSEYKRKIQELSDIIHTYDFNLNKEEFEELTSKWQWYIHCSYFDSCPLSIIEMKQSGKHIIATSNFAIPELLQSDDIILKDPKSVFDEITFLPKERLFLDDFIIENSLESAKYERSLYDDINTTLKNLCINQTSTPVKIPSKLSSSSIINAWQKIIKENV